MASATNVCNMSRLWQLCHINNSTQHAHCVTSIRQPMFWGGCEPFCVLNWRVSLLTEIRLNGEVSKYRMWNRICKAYHSGPVFYLLSWSPSHLKFFPKSLDHFLSPVQVPWKPSHQAKSQVTSVADLGISWVALTSLFVLCIFLNEYMRHYVVCFIMYLQKAIRIIFIDELGIPWHRFRQHRRHRGLLWCCIQWRHYSVDAWRRNSVDADAWRRQQRITRRTIGRVPK